MRQQGKTIFLMLLCSIVFLSGCQAESRQGKEEYEEETEGQEIYHSAIPEGMIQISRKAEDLKNQFFWKLSERRLDTDDWNQIYADYKMELEEDAMDLLLYLDVIKEFQEEEAGEWRQARYELTDLDGDGIPEFFLEKPEGWVKIYSFKDGSVSLILDEEINSDLKGTVQYYQLPNGVMGVLKKSTDKGDSAYCRMNEQGELGSWYVVRETLSEDGKIYYEHEGKEVPREKFSFYAMGGSFRTLGVKKLPEYKPEQDAEWILAYREVLEVWCEEDRKCLNGLSFDLVYFDEDEIPELVIEVGHGERSIYTIKNGTVFQVVSELGSKYGVDYLPKQGIVKMDGVSEAGAVQYTAYMYMNEQKKLEDWYCLTAEYYGTSEAMNSEDWNYFYEDQEVSKEMYESYVIEDNFEPLFGGKKLYEYFFVFEE